jgi:ABC-type uncharacterized transport system substrate-binding protein
MPELFTYAHRAPIISAAIRNNVPSVYYLSDFARDADRLPALAADLVDQRVAVIFATAPTSVPKAAQAATDTIPIVFVTNSDPVAVGLVASLSRPGGNITGVAFLTEQLNAKRLQLLHEAVPSARTIAYLFNPTTFDDGRIGRVEAGALSLGVGLSIVNATTPRDRSRVCRNCPPAHRSTVGLTLIRSSSRSAISSLRLQRGTPCRRSIKPESTSRPAVLWATGRLFLMRFAQQVFTSAAF